jgi:hypothetical protein
LNWINLELRRKIAGDDVRLTLKFETVMGFKTEYWIRIVEIESLLGNSRLR